MGTTATRLLVGTLALALVGAAPQGSGARHALNVVDRVPRFVKFYADASRPGGSEADRWSLWQREYGIAAVPPTPQGYALARKQLDAAWSKYPALASKLLAMESAAAVEARSSFDEANALFATSSKTIESTIVLYVGQFDDNSFTVPAMKGHVPTVVMPIEHRNLRVALAHELAHTVNFQLAGVKNSFGAPIGETVFIEGLAMRASQRLVPGLPEARYLDNIGEPAWLPRCYSHQAAIVRGMLPYLSQSGSDVATRFTFGTGTTGMDREAYCAGWLLVGDLLAAGKTFPELARVPESRMPALVRDAALAHLKVTVHSAPYARPTSVSASE